MAIPKPDANLIEKLRRAKVSEKLFRVHPICDGDDTYSRIPIIDLFIDLIRNEALIETIAKQHCDNSNCDMCKARKEAIEGYIEALEIPSEKTRVAWFCS